MLLCKRLRDYLDGRKIKYVVISHSQAFTAQEIAARIHVPGRELAKTVVIKTPRGLSLAVVRAQDKVDMDLMGSLMGAPARLATEIEFRSAFPDCEVGAMPPFGSLYKLPTLVDQELARDEDIVFNAGTHTDAIRMSYADFEANEKPTVARLTTSLAAMAR